MCRRATAAFRIGGGGAVSAAFDDAGRCDIDLFTRRKAARAPSKNRSLFVSSFRLDREIIFLRSRRFAGALVSLAFVTA